MLSQVRQLHTAVSWEIFKNRHWISALFLLMLLLTSLGFAALPTFAENGGGSGVCVGCP
jgi:hypothetical protein